MATSLRQEETHPPKETSSLPFEWDFIKKALQELFQRTKKFNLESVGQRTGDVAIVTGGARGIGADVVKKLLQCDFNVILGVRNTEAAQKFVSGLRENGIKTGKTDFVHLDLKSFNSVRKFAKHILKEYPKIHLLICNAGVMFTPYELTEDGFELQFQVDYLSHFLLTELLLSRMIETAQFSSLSGRIVNVSSAVNWCGNIKDISNIETRRIEYNRYKAYFDSKLCQITASNYLDKLLRNQNANVYVYSLHPGGIPTELGAHIASPPWFLKRFLRTTDDGADVILCAGTGPEFEKRGGIFLMNCQVELPNSQSLDVDVQKAVWRKSYELIRVKERA